MVDNYAEILETSLKVIFDLFLVFGIEAFAEDDKPEKTKEQKEEVLEVHLLDQYLIYFSMTFDDYMTNNVPLSIT